jgi:hypothetical protein
VKPKLKHILKENGKEYIRTYGDRLSPYVITVLLAVMNCGTNRNGYRSFFCHHCHNIKRVPFSCKKRLCPSCSQWANHRFANNFAQRMLPVTHRHLTMTIPRMLWDIIHDDPDKQRLLVQASYKTIQQIMRIYLKVEVRPGALSVLHNYGRDLKKNCHVHMIVTEGGEFNGEWYKFTYFPFVKRGRVYTTINSLWRDNVLETLRLSLPRTERNQRFLRAILRKYPNGFYVFGDNSSRIKTNRSAFNKAKYITRYVRHPPISDRRIKSYNGQNVTIWYDQPSTLERIEVTFSVLEFIDSIIVHLPKNRFHMVVYYGLYSPRYINAPVVQMIFTISGDVKDPKKLTWRESIMLSTGQDPLACKYCKEEMIFVCIVYQWKRRLKVKYHLMVDDLSAIGYPDENSFVRKLG